jgi:hypothetical protein
MKRLDVGQRWHSRLGAAGLAAVIVLGATPARADDPDPAVIQLLGMFATICLDTFPDDAAVEKLVAERKFDVMAEDRLRRLLGTDPGMGWVLTTGRGQYLLTIELPPYHACAVRKADRTPPDFLGTFGVVVTNWAATQTGANFKQRPMETPQIGSAQSELYSWELDRGPGKPVETLMALISKLPGIAEVRLVRSIQVQ